VTIFRPPTDDIVRYSDFGGQGIAHRLFRFYKPEPRGRNVYSMNDGSFSEADLVDPTTYTKIYFGGSENEVTAAEAAALTAGGYGAYIT